MDDPDDPNNWSPLRRYFEAFKGIKKLLTGPHETIPEDLVRMVLAQQYGIKPEEVTWKQIRSAVAELLPVYPAITLVPSPVCSGLTQGAIESNVEQKMSRRAFIEPLLKAKGWSILDWANEADVSHATAMDYLKGKTSPYRSTRLKLAKALDISVDQLPE